MSGLLFDYFDGFLRVEFRNGRWAGDIEIVFHVNGGTIVTTPCDDNFEKGEPEIDLANDTALRCWTSSTMSWFFRDMTNWLEAVTCGVAECAFSWDGEGPDGELRWFGRRESGTLKMAWTGRHDSMAFAREVRLNKSQMVGALYHSFREFVESDRYDPISYEKLLYAEVFDLVLTDGRAALVRELVVRDRLGAYTLVQTIMGIAHDYDKGFPRSATLSEFILKAESYWEGSSYDEEWVQDQINYMFDETWNDWAAEQRQQYVEEKFYRLVGCDGNGENLRELRSPLVESWLATQPSVTADDRAVTS